jgi:hypothetical protein
MSDLKSNDDFVLSPGLIALILDTPTLRTRLFPEGILSSPYEVLDYKATVIIHDRQGRRVTLKRQERIRFLQEGVSAILDHAWGNGVVVTSYQTDAGRIEGSLRDDGKRHLVIGLKREMHRGDILDFSVERTIVGAVTGRQEWLETIIDHPIRQLTCNIVFPKARPCQRATFTDEQTEANVPLVVGSNGLTLVHFHKTLPRQHTPYTLSWNW